MASNATGRNPDLSKDQVQKKGRIKADGNDSNGKGSGSTPGFANADKGKGDTSGWQAAGYRKKGNNKE